MSPGSGARLSARPCTNNRRRSVSIARLRLFEAGERPFDIIDISTYINIRVTDRQLVRALRALADKTRFRMAQRIASAGELSCGEVGQHTDLRQSTVSHHLKILADAEIISIRRQGQHAMISINHEFLDGALALLPRRLAGAAGGHPGQTTRSRTDSRAGRVDTRRRS